MNDFNMMDHLETQENARFNMEAEVERDTTTIDDDGLDFDTLGSVESSLITRAGAECSVEESCTLGEAPAAGTKLKVVTLHDPLNLRAPDNIDNVIGSIPRNRSDLDLESMGESRNFMMGEDGKVDVYLKVKYNGTEGYAHAGYLDLVETDEPVEVPEENEGTASGPSAEFIEIMESEAASEWIQERDVAVTSDLGEFLLNIKSAIEEDDSDLPEGLTLDLVNAELERAGVNPVEPDAEPDVEPEVESEPSIQELTERADAFRRAEDFEAALPLYIRLTEMESTNAQNFKLAAYCLGRLERYDEALEYIDRAIVLDSNDASFHNNRGFYLYNLGRIEEAIPALRRALEIDPNYERAQEKLDRYTAELEAENGAGSSDDGSGATDFWGY